MTALARSFVAWVLLISVAAAAPALGPAGLWLGELDLGVIKLRLGMEVVDDAAGKLSVVLVSIDQGGARILAEDPLLASGELTVPLPSIGGKFVGELSENGQEISGTWTQAGTEAPLSLRRVDRLPTQRRPQEPKPPLPYDSEEVAFENPNRGHTLAGTLTLPRTAAPHPALVLITGSGPQDRDESLLGHKPFLVLADALTRRGVAVLRCDDRGVGDSKGDFSSATSDDFVSDALAAVRFLAGRDDIDAKRIGLCGHSEGAMVAAMVGAKKPEQVAALVLLAPPAIRGEEIILTQGRLLETKMGLPDAAAAARADLRRRAIRAAIDSETDEAFVAELDEAVDAYVAGLPDEKTRDAERKLFGEGLRVYRTRWFRCFLAFDPTDALRRLECPVLAVLGQRDVQVVPDANLPPLRAALAAAPTTDVTIENPPGINHLLQSCQTGLPTEYGTIEETIAPTVLDLISEWAASRLGVE